MKVFEHYTDYKKWQKKKVVCTIGNFDGVHCAHQKILLDIKKIAQRCNAASLVMTFKNHPLQVGTRKEKPIVTSLPHKLILLDRFDIDACFVFNFTKKLRQKNMQ